MSPCRTSCTGSKGIPCSRFIQCLLNPYFVGLCPFLFILDFCLANALTHLSLYKVPKMHGNTLLETVFALWLLGTTAWAAVHTHLQTRDAAHAFQLRTQALQLLEATAQALESGEAILNVQRRAQMHAMTQLPDGRVVIKTLSTTAFPDGYLTRPLLLVEVLWDTRLSKPTLSDAAPLKQRPITSNAYGSSHRSSYPQSHLLGGAHSVCVVVAQ